ncbi:guanylate cyclase soluble subunit beta-1 isoform X3 [Hydra vulgaris]|uniref:Guanylate cyclase soluble subunit beta-1 n=2 Tax=Hydra vulgaris TaxID=6087 RepID=A0ABM4D274_HYDVU
MFGFFINGFEKFITSKYGEDCWVNIRMEAGVFEDSFDEKMVYDDNMIFEIIDAACEILDLEEEELHEEFGECYFSHCLASSHGKLLKALGGSLYDFLSNIDSLHDHLCASYAGIKIPTFRVKPDASSRSISVNYYSDRNDFEYVTKGIIKAAAKILFKLEVDIETVYDADSIKFLITTNDFDECHLMFPKLIESSRDLIPRANEAKVSPFEFSKVFPFHMLFDRNMTLLQVGSTLKRILKDINTTKDAKITSFFQLTRPQIKFDFESIYSRINNAFVLTFQNNVVKQSVATLQANNEINTRRANLRLKGEMIYLEERDQMLYLCSPSVSNIEDMRNKGLCLSDIPIHDATRDLVLLSENLQKQRELMQQLHIVSDHLFKINTELEEEMHLYDRLLFSVLPPSIAKDLQESRPVSTERFSSVTLMFSGIVNFSDLCEEMECLDIVNMLNSLYVKFDTLVDFMTSYVYKVETVGDKYMTASGLPEKCSNHPQVICTLALDMLDVSKEIRIKEKRIQVTFGIHSGEVVAGVIGQRTPRYCLFGNAVNLTSRTESTGIKGKINVTEETYKLLQQAGTLDMYDFERRGQVSMKGKSEPMTTYILSRQECLGSNNPMVFMVESASMQSSTSLLTSSGAGGGAFTLNRTGVTNGRKSRNSSVISSRFNTPGVSRTVSRFATPFRSRCNSAMSSVANLNPNHLPSPANSEFEFDEEVGFPSFGSNSSHLSVPHSLCPQIRSPRMRSQNIETTLQE